MTNKINRREFIKASSVAAFGFTILPSFLKGAPSDKVRVAHIGLGGMGNEHMNWFARLPQVDIVALCDLDEEHLNGTFKKLQEIHPDSKAQLYGDFRKVLERKDIDAISVATPDHWHATIATLAFQAGKDVYGEKPLSYSVQEGQIMLKNQKRYDRVFQLGTQIHAGNNYHRAVEIIRSGAIGKVHTVRVWKTGFSPGLGHPTVQTPPKTLNWDMWLGPAPYAEYFPERCHFSYRYFLDYSGGVFADFWCHISDVVWWAVNPTGLKSVVARGEKTDGVATAPKWLDADMEFDNLKLYWTSQIPDVPGAAGKHIGAYFEGDKGTALVDYNTTQITIGGQVMDDLPSVPKTIERSPGHQQNFIDAVKSRKMPESNLAYAREMTLPMHLALTSWRLNRKLEWNAKKEMFKDDKEANGFLYREPRKGWDLI
ncbi:MAG TPA: Gfo/Idh/MocA family oxidoreductase [Cyclobacteriaceae bacterium]|nr:Gfo/Idh/MocA family oxidoreductase [Cyclobacteriaceae bacterium]